MNKAYTNSRPLESFCKLKSIENGLDIHGSEWQNRVILNVVAFDKTNSILIVQNPNGLQWSTNLKTMVFCLENGNHIYN